MGKCLQETLCNTFRDILIAIPKLRGVDSLLSHHLFETTFDHAEQLIIEKLLIPSEDKNNAEIGVSFALFIGFDFQCSDEIKYKSVVEFNRLLHKEIQEKIKNVLVNIEEVLDQFNIVDSELNCYLVPFKSTDEFCQSFLEDI